MPPIASAFATVDDNNKIIQTSFSCAAKWFDHIRKHLYEQSVIILLPIATILWKLLRAAESSRPEVEMHFRYLHNQLVDEDGIDCPSFPQRQRQRV